MEQTVQERIENLLEDPEETQEPDSQVPEDEEAEQDDSQEEVVEASEEEAEEVEEVQITSLADWAEHDGIEIADAYSITIPVSENGQTKEVPIGELKDSYQASQVVRAAQEKLTKQMQEFEETSAKRKEEMGQHFYTAAKMVESIERSVIGEMNTPQMAELRQTDPAEYAAAFAEHQERSRSVASMKQELASEYAQYKEREKAELEAKQAQYIQKAFAVLPQIIPEWADERVAKQEAPMIRDYGTRTGFTEEDMSKIYDPRLLKVFRDAALHSKQEAAKPEQKKKVASIGKKVLKSGKSKSKVDRKHDAFKADRKKLRGSGDVRDAAALFEKHFLGDM